MTIHQKHFKKSLVPGDFSHSRTGELAEEAVSEENEKRTPDSHCFCQFVFPFAYLSFIVWFLNRAVKFFKV
jgi:hypothetical protein